MSDSSLVILDIMTTATNYAKTLTSTTIDAVPLTFLTCSQVQGIPFNCLTEFRQPLQVQSHLEMPRILVQLGHTQRT